jgi:hypothetical protein
LFLLLPLLRTIFQCASWVICWWLHWQHRCEVTCVCTLVVCPECPYLL